MAPGVADAGGPSLRPQHKGGGGSPDLFSSRFSVSITSVVMGTARGQDGAGLVRVTLSGVTGVLPSPPTGSSPAPPPEGSCCLGACSARVYG